MSCVRADLVIVASGSRAARPVLRLQGLTKRFGSRIAVDHVDLDVRRGETLALLGPNGSGKTTLVRMVCGLLAPTSGRIEAAWADGGRAASVGYCPQADTLYDELTVQENLRFVAALYRMPTSDANRRARELIQALGLAPHTDRQARHLSGGMRRRLTLAVAAVHDPDVLVIEEPEAGLDPRSLLAVRQFVGGLGPSRTVLLTSHNISAVEAMADRVAILDDGRIVAIGTPRQIARLAHHDPGQAGSAPRGSTPTLETAFLRLTQGTNA